MGSSARSTGTAAAHAKNEGVRRLPREIVGKGEGGVPVMPDEEELLLALVYHGGERRSPTREEEHQGVLASH